MGWTIWSSIHDWDKRFPLLQNDQITHELRTYPRGYSGRVIKLTTHLHLLEEYVIQRSVENTYYTINDHLAAVLQTMGLPEIWSCHSDADADFGLLEYNAVQTGYDQPIEEPYCLHLQGSPRRVRVNNQNLENYHENGGKSTPSPPKTLLDRPTWYHTRLYHTPENWNLHWIFIISHQCSAWNRK
jgi:hypothetical protein